VFDRSRYEPKQLILASLRAMVRDFDGDAVSCDDAVAMVDWFSAVKRLAAAGETLAATRAAAGAAWRDAGDRSPADWLAKRTGTTVGEARAALGTGAALPSAPATDAALRAGALSARQAEAIAPAAAADPSAEARLLEMATYQSLQKLRDEAARVKAAADTDGAARHERIRRERSFRTFGRPDGSHSGVLTGTPEDIAQPFIDQRLDEARRTGERESSEAYAFDGVLAMARSTMVDACADGDDNAGDDASGDDGCGGAPGGDVRTARGGRGRKRLSERRELLCIVNLESLLRGSVGAGEVCEIPGVGPVLLETARTLFGDSLLRIVIRDGVDIRTVVHTGRTANALQETGIFVRQNGRCDRPGCRFPIAEIDHTEDYVRTGQTTFDDLGGLCTHDHDNKTRYGHTYRRESDGTVVWIRPDGAEERERPPP
jgi:hypothetical protein